MSHWGHVPASAAAAFACLHFVTLTRKGNLALIAALCLVHTRSLLTLTSRLRWAAVGAVAAVTQSHMFKAGLRVQSEDQHLSGFMTCVFRLARGWMGHAGTTLGGRTGE